MQIPYLVFRMIINLIDLAGKVLVFIKLLKVFINGRFRIIITHQIIWRYIWFEWWWSIKFWWAAAIVFSIFIYALMILWFWIRAWNFHWPWHWRWFSFLIIVRVLIILWMKLNISFMCWLHWFVNFKSISFFNILLDKLLVRTNCWSIATHRF